MIGRRGFLGGLLACFGLAKAAPASEPTGGTVSPEGQYGAIHNWVHPLGLFSIVLYRDGRKEIWFPDGDRISIPATKGIGESFITKSLRGRRFLLNRLDEDRFTIVAAECV